jgi:hypothetical protein
MPRPPQEGSRNFKVTASNRFEPPPSIAIDALHNAPVWLAPVNCPGFSPEWEDKTIYLDTSEGVWQEYERNRPDLIHRAPSRPAPVAARVNVEEDSAARRARRWYDSDGVSVSSDGGCASYSMPSNERTCVLSQDYVSTADTPVSTNWNVKYTTRSTSGGEFYFGVTEACSFDRQGRSFLCDAWGNLYVGWCPMLLSHIVRASEVCMIEKAEKRGTFPGAQTLDGVKEVAASVTVDLAAQTITFACYDGVIVYPVEQLATARLCVSLSSEATVQLT